MISVMPTSAFQAVDPAQIPVGTILSVGTVDGERDHRTILNVVAQVITPQHAQGYLILRAQNAPHNSLLVYDGQRVRFPTRLERIALALQELLAAQVGSLASKQLQYTLRDAQQELLREGLREWLANPEEQELFTIIVEKVVQVVFGEDNLLDDLPSGYPWQMRDTLNAVADREVFRAWLMERPKSAQFERNTIYIYDDGRLDSTHTQLGDPLLQYVYEWTRGRVQGQTHPGHPPIISDRSWVFRFVKALPGHSKGVIGRSVVLSALNQVI